MEGTNAGHIWAPPKKTSSTHTTTITEPQVGATLERSHHLGLEAQTQQLSPALLPGNAAVPNNLAWLYQETAKQVYDLAPNSPATMETYGWMMANIGKSFMQ